MSGRVGEEALTCVPCGVPIGSQGSSFEAFREEFWAVRSFKQKGYPTMDIENGRAATPTRLVRKTTILLVLAATFVGSAPQTKAQ